MIRTIPLPLQTLYAELLDRATSAAFAEAFAEDGVFTAKAVGDRRYWYFQTSADAGKKQRYVGPEKPELLERIRRHREYRHDQRERQTLVSTLVRSAHLPRPLPQLGAIVEALAKAGVFRPRGVLVGTVAYQTYPAMLGARLSAAAIQTADVDIAQFREVSIAIGDSIPPILTVLKAVHNSFREVPGLHGPQSSTSFQAKGGIRVDFLTPNRGPDSDVPQSLPALQTAAQPIRFLDFLIHDPEPAVVLHGAGIHVQVPAPQRYALHKLIVARRRRQGSAKSNKDLQQAEALLEALVTARPQALREAWDEAISRGDKWRQLIGEGLGKIKPDVRDETLRAVFAPRSILPGLDLKFGPTPTRYDFDRDIVTFSGEAGRASVRCAVSREALEDHFGADRADKNGRLAIFRKNRDLFERMCRIKFLNWPVEEVGSILLRTVDIPTLRKAADDG